MKSSLRTLFPCLTAVILSALICSLTPAIVFAQDNQGKPIEDKWALVIGIDKFKDKRIPTLRYSAKDARDFADSLIKKGNFAGDHIKVLLNEEATQEAIEEALGDTWLPRRALSNDLVLIYISTHGSPQEIDVGKDNWLIAHNTNIDKLYSTGIELTSLAETVKKRTGCERVVLFLDACNSGAAQTGASKGLVRPSNFDINSLVGEGAIVISSSDSNQRSWESRRYQNGVFTRKLIETLSGGGADRPIQDVYEELRSTVEQEVRFDRKATQTPVFKSKWKGAPLILAAKPARPRNVIEPPPANFPEPEPVPDSQEARTGGEGTTAVASAASGQTETPATSVSRDGGTLAGKVNRDRLVLTKKLAFVGVVPPAQYKIRMSASYGKVSKRDYDGISHFPRLLYSAIEREITSQLGDQTVDKGSIYKALKGLGNQSSATPSATIIKSLATSTGAQNIAYVYTTKFNFKGQVAWSNVYDIACLVKVYDGKTGTLKAEFKEQAKKQPWLGDSTSWWVDYVTDKIIPPLAKDISKGILKNL